MQSPVKMVASSDFLKISTIINSESAELQSIVCVRGHGLLWRNKRFLSRLNIASKKSIANFPMRATIDVWPSGLKSFVKIKEQQLMLTTSNLASILVWLFCCHFRDLLCTRYSFLYILQRYKVSARDLERGTGSINRKYRFDKRKCRNEVVAVVWRKKLNDNERKLGWNSMSNS